MSAEAQVVLGALAGVGLALALRRAILPLPVWAARANAGTILVAAVLLFWAGEAH